MKNLASVFGTAGIAALSCMACGPQVARADLIPYSNIGTPNPVIYNFTATASGNITAYFAGDNAGYDTDIGLLVNGVSTGITGLDDHSTAVGTSLNLGFAAAGSTLTFVLINNSIGMDAYSNPSLNVNTYDVPGETANGHNHVYSTAYTGTVPVPIPGGGTIPTGVIPAGTYVAFEDAQFNGGTPGQVINGLMNSDFDYNDETFIFTDVTTRTGVPDSASSLTLLSIGFAGLSLLRRRFGA